MFLFSMADSSLIFVVVEIVSKYLIGIPNGQLAEYSSLFFLKAGIVFRKSIYNFHSESRNQMENFLFVCLFGPQFRYATIVHTHVSFLFFWLHETRQ